MSSNKHWFGTESKSPGNGHPVLFGFAPALQFERMPDGGGYPIGFLQKAYTTMGVTDPNRVLHLCSGSLRIGTRVDIRPEMHPTVVADVRKLPFPDTSFDWIMADPPYAESYADQLYGTKDVYPAPGAIVAEMGRLLRPGGTCGILHFLCPQSRKPLELVGVWGVTTGQNYAIRAWSVYRKPGQQSWL